METVTTRVEVNIYKVQDVHGDDIEFRAEVDDDGDIIVHLEEETCGYEQVKDFAFNNMDDLIKDSCETGLRMCLEAIKEQRPMLFKEVAEDEQ